jgi:hypothetical protein
MTGLGDEMAAAAGGTGRLRASHADREQVVDVLKTAFVQGRLAKDEFVERMGQAFTARTYAELAALIAGIPAGPTTAPPLPKPARAHPPVNIPVIIGTTVLTAGLWAAVLSANLDGGAIHGLLAAFTFACLGILTLAGVMMLESRRQRRSGGPLPPAADP